jgi:hypothetical protein
MFTRHRHFSIPRDSEEALERMRLGQELSDSPAASTLSQYIGVSQYLSGFFAQTTLSECLGLLAGVNFGVAKVS